MKRHIYILLLFILSFSYSNAQEVNSIDYDSVTYKPNYLIYKGDTVNRIDKNGLWYGKWYFFNNCSITTHSFKENKKAPKDCIPWKECNYVIVEMPDSIHRLSVNSCMSTANYYNGNDTLMFEYTAHFRNQFSVIDGDCIIYTYEEPSSLVTCKLHYEKGYLLGFTDYYSDGTIRERSQCKIINNHFAVDVYHKQDSVPYLRYTYTNGGKYYYPENILSTPKKKYLIYPVFSLTDTLNIAFFSNSHDTVFIKDISCVSNQFKLYNEELVDIHNITIPPMDTFYLPFVYYPSRSNFRHTDTISLYVKNENTPYSFIIHVINSDINFKNYKEMQEFNISLSDQYKPLLYLRDIGYHTHYILTNQEGDVLLKGMTPSAGSSIFNFEKYGKGFYNLEIWSNIDEKYNYKINVTK